MCLAAPALGSNWTGGNGNWNLGGNWSAGVPIGTDAYIGNGGTVTLNAAALGDVTTLDVAWFSTLNIETGAALTATGNVNVAGGGNDFGTVAQSGGVVSLETNLFLGNASGDLATWTMTADGSLAIGANLHVGGGGQGTFQLQDDSALIVVGNINIAAANGSASMAVSGGTLGQLAGGGDPAILADLNISGGSFAVQGDASTINVGTYAQTVGGALEITSNDTGISPIHVDGNVNLGGSLNVIVSATLPAGTYDLIVSETGTVLGEFDHLALGDRLEVRYEQNGEGKDAVRLRVYGDEEEVPILGQLPRDPYNKIVSINIKGDPAFDAGVIPDVEDGAGAVPADNWNNIEYFGVESTPKTYSGFEDESGAPAVWLSLLQNGRVRALGSVTGREADPNLNLYESRAAIADKSILDPNVTHTFLEGLQTEFPHGYEVIINIAGGGSGNTPNVIVYDGVAKALNGARDANVLEEISVTTGSFSYSSGAGFRPGENYVKLSNMLHDTLDLRLDPSDGLQITGVQILGLAPGELEPIEFIVDDGDRVGQERGPWKESGGWDDDNASDSWAGDSRLASAAGKTMEWHPPGNYEQWADDNGDYLRTALPILDLYEVYVWYSAEDPDHPDTYLARDSAAVYKVYEAGWSFADPSTITTIIIDQNLRDDVYGSGKWVLLGTFPFGGHSALSEGVLLTSSGNGPTSGDAVMWRYVMSVPEPPEPVIPEPAGLGVIGLALLAVRRRRS